MSESALSARKLTAAERREKAVEMRKRGARFADIAKELGMSVSAAHKTVQVALRDALDKANLDAAEMRELEAQRLDTRELRINTAIHKAMSAADYNLVARLDAQLDRIAQRRARLFGLDEPERHDVTSGGARVEIALRWPEDADTEDAD